MAAPGVQSGVYCTYGDFNVYGTYPRKAVANGGGVARGILRNHGDVAPPVAARPTLMPLEESFESAPSGGGGERCAAVERHVRPCVAEFLAVFLAVFVCAVVESALRAAAADWLRDALVVSACEALCFVCFVVTFACKVHMSPAVSLGSLFAVSTSWCLCLFFLLIQLAAAVVGVALQTLTTSGGAPAQPTVRAGDWLSATYQLVLSQAVGSFIVVLCFLVVAQRRCGSCGAAESQHVGGIAAAIALANFMSYLCSTASWNPIRTTAIVIVRSLTAENADWTHHYVFWLGPLIGSLFASFLYRLLFADDEKRLSIC